MKQQDTIFRKKDIIFIELIPNEKILSIERQHWITLLITFLTHTGIVFVLFGISIIFFLFDFPSFSYYLFFYMILALLCLMAVIGTYTCMDWYYTYYIVTTKRVIIRHFFKIIGEYYKEVYLQIGVRYEVERIASNLLFDVLDIESIYIDFRQLNVSEPFIFDLPQHPENIERALYAIEEMNE